MKNTLNFLRILNSIVSLGIMGYVGYKYAKQCGDIEKLTKEAKEILFRHAKDCENRTCVEDLDHECHCDACHCGDAETPSEPME